MKPFKIVCVIGTRPEALKMAPLIKVLSANPAFDVKTLLSAQHRELLDQMLVHFSIQIDADFNIMTHNQHLTELNAKLLLKFDNYYQATKPDLVIAQGDTTTTMVAAMSAYYHKIPFAHIEAGLRTSDIYTPFPEEMNRRVASQLSALHFAPTQFAKQNLAREGIHNRVFVVGNTIIDTLYHFSKQFQEPLAPGKKLILTTCHRRENFGQPLHDICEAMKTLATQRDDIQFVFPVHPNPNVQEVVYTALGGIANIQLTTPMDYIELVKHLKASYLVLTDSGGLQEEAPALGKPVLVLREETERPEGVLCGAAKLIGTGNQEIIDEITLLLDNPEAYQRMVVKVSPYGDGKASERISWHIENYLSKRESHNLLKENEFNFDLPIIESGLPHLE